MAIEAQHRGSNVGGAHGQLAITKSIVDMFLIPIRLKFFKISFNESFMKSFKSHLNKSFIRSFMSIK